MIIVGLDWSRSKHDFVIMDLQGKVIERGAVAHNANALEELAARIERQSNSDKEVRVGLELNDGALLAWLVTKGYTTFGIQPKSAQRAREIYRPGGSKDDRIDAFVLAEFVRINVGRLKPWHPPSQITLELRELLRWREELVQQRTAAYQRLRALLAEWSPQLAELCDNLDCIWQLDLLSQFPTETRLCQAHGNRIRSFVRNHRMHLKKQQQIEDIRRSIPMPVPVGRVQVVERQTSFLVEQIRMLTAEIKHIEEDLQQLTAQHPDVNVFESLPVQGIVTIASLLAIFSDDRKRAISVDELAALCGVAPVTIASGKAKRVRQRRACDHTFRQALVHFAFNTAFCDGCWAVQFYQRKRSEGATHYVALRCLAKRWLKILHRIWKDHITYNEQLHQANQKRNQSHAA
ncbi:MAG: IS110 family transposase [Phycisphaerae bacterium]